MSSPTSTSAIRADGRLTGPYRNVANPNVHAGAGSIHDHETASKLGFRSGTVAGSNHMDLFAPLAHEAWGKRWFERGSLSLYFKNATIDGEPVRASITEPRDGANAQVDAFVDREDGMRVAEGSIAVGEPGVLPALQALPLDLREPGELRILAGLAAGDPIEEQGVVYSPDQQAQRLRVNTEILDWYRDQSPWGKPIITPAGMVGLLYAAPSAAISRRMPKPRAVGLFGAIEIAQVNGPALVDTPYRVRGTIVALGQSPKTEYFWFDTEALDPDDRVIATMRMQLRFMKASSPFYAEK